MNTLEELSVEMDNKSKFDVIEKNDNSKDGFIIVECRIISINIIHEKGFDATVFVKYIKQDDNEYNMNFKMDELDFLEQNFESVMIDINKKFKLKNKE